MDKFENFNWNRISINRYYEINEILTSDEDDLTKNVQLLSTISEKDEDYFWDMDMNDIGEWISHLTFLNSFRLIELPKKFKFGDWTLNLVQEPTNLTVSQFFDYQQFIKMPLKQSITKILSVFLIPEGKKYNSGYDILELQRYLGDNMTFQMAQSVLNFLMGMSLASMRRSLQYLTRKNPTEMTKTQIRELEEKIQGLCSLGL